MDVAVCPCTQEEIPRWDTGQARGERWGSRCGWGLSAGLLVGWWAPENKEPIPWSQPQELWVLELSGEGPGQTAGSSGSSES